MNSNQLYEDFFQKNNSYYLEQLKYYNNGKKFRFSYAALIFGLFWFLYRKMYLEFFLIFIFYYVETIFENTILIKLIGRTNKDYKHFSDNNISTYFRNYW